MVASLRDSSSVARLSRRLSPTLPAMSFGVRDDAVGAAVLVEPLRGGLRPDLRHARDVVRAVADQREVVDDLLGQHVELRLDARAVELRVEHRVDERDAVVHELRHVLVAGRDDDLEALARRALGERADHVVGLDARRCAAAAGRARESPRSAARSARAGRRASAAGAPCIPRTARRGTCGPARRARRRSAPGSLPSAACSAC